MAERKKQKRESHHVLLQKRRDSSFIAEYVKRNHPETYTEAESFLNKLREQYPHKRDCTKTHEFLTSTTGYVDYKQYYNRKRMKHLNNGTASSTTSSTASSTASSTPSSTASSTTSADMVLTIPLIPKPVVAENTAPLQVVSPEINQALITEIVNDPQLHGIFTEFENMQDFELDEALNDLDDTTTGLSPLEKELLTYH